MSKVYGIDLGTTYSVIARLDDNGMPAVIENFADSVPELASAVYFPEGGDPVIGKEAKNQAQIEAHRVVQFIKRQIGKPDAETFEFDGVTYDPISISALILKRMKEYAAEQGYEVEDVVITCPAYFGNEEKAATRQAGIIAGFNVLDVVHEPTAAALNYCIREFQENRKIMVYDLGGGTFDITIFNFSVSEEGAATIEVIATGGNDRLGGIDWDARLEEYICRLYEEETGISEADMDSILKQMIKREVETTKLALTNMQTKSFAINYDGDSTRIEVTRENFEAITADLVEQTLDFVRKALGDAGLSEGDIDTVLLVGGSSKMPMIRNAMDSMFSGKVRMEDPNLAVAKGAAIAAAVIWNETRRVEQGEKKSDSVVGTESGAEEEKGIIELGGSMGPIEFVDKLTRSFGIAANVNGEYMVNNMLFRGDEMPVECTQNFLTSVENQRLVKAPIFENVSEDRENPFITPCIDRDGNEQYTDPDLMVKDIGVLAFDIPAGINLPKGSDIEITFSFSKSGLLSVHATLLATGETYEAVITSANTKTAEELAAEAERFADLSTTGMI